MAYARSLFRERAFWLLIALVLVAVVAYEIPVAMGQPRWVARTVGIGAWGLLLVWIDRDMWPSAMSLVIGGSLVAHLDNPTWYHGAVALAQIVAALAWYASGRLYEPPQCMTLTRALHWLGAAVSFAGGAWAGGLAYARGTGPVDPYAVPHAGGVAAYVGLPMAEIGAAVLLACCIVAAWRTYRHSG